jgi:beta-N-acetylhexosaminidase
LETNSECIEVVIRYGPQHRSRRRRLPDMLAERRMTGSLTLVLIILIGALAACSASTATPPPRSSGTSSPSAVTSSPTPSAVSPAPATASPGGATASPTPSAAVSCAQRILASLPETQRIGQLFAVGLANDRFDAAARAAVADHGFGSWWFTKTTTAGGAAIRDVADAIQAASTGRATGGIGAFVAANQEGGQIQALRGPGFARIPSAVIQGTWAAATLRDAAERWGMQLAAAGVNLDFAPVADVVPAGTAADNAPIGQLEREYGSTPANVAAHVAAFIAGMHQAGIVTTAKHFPGLGRVAQNTDFSSGVVDDVTTADDAYLTPFARAIDVGVPAVMLSLATYERLDPDRLAAFSKGITGNLLTDDLGFGGVVMSDSLSAEAVASIPVGSRAIRFLQAGGDMIVVRPVDMAVTMAKAVAARVATDTTFAKRVDDAVLRVLAAKAAAGLLPC